MIALRHSLSLSSRSIARGVAVRGFLSDVPMGPADPILGLTEEFNADTFEKKVQ